LPKAAQFSLLFHNAPALLPAMRHGTMTRHGPDPGGAPEGEEDHVVRGGHDNGALWLIRHGESTWNVRGLAQGHCDEARLTARGERQATELATELSTQPIKTLYASDLRRALETAAPLAEVLGLTVTHDARLRERSLGVLEGSASAAISPEVTGLRAQRVADPDARPDGGESVRDLYERATSFADELATRDHPGDVAVVAHGGTLRVLYAYLHGIAVERMAWEPLENGRILRWPAQSQDRSPRPRERNGDT
jgi:2,3-bisphosphoglycerate-dependent phosphoglycerate mutase